MDSTENIVLLQQLFQCSHGLHGSQKYRGQSRLLILLLENGTLTQRELIDITGRRSATLSEQLANMESAGYITRKIHDSDRRNVEVTLTDSGREVAADAASSRRRLADTLFEDYSPEEKKALGRFLGEINQKFSQMLS